MRLKSILVILLIFVFNHGFAATSASIATQIPINFGTYDPYSPANLDTVGRLMVNCSGGGSVAYSIALSMGNSNNYLTRKMFSGHHSLNYNLYTNATRTVVWGDGTRGTGLVSTAGSCITNSNFQQVVYARIPALQESVAVGTYSDMVVLTLNY